MSTTARAPLFLLDSQTHEEVIHIPLAPTELRAGRQTIVLFDLYCDNPDCGGVCLAAYRVDGEVTGVERTQEGGPRITARRPVGYLPDLYCPLSISLSDGIVSFPQDHAPTAGHRELLDQVQASLLPEHLDLLRRRQQPQSADQDKDWKQRDWSWVQKGMCVGWAEMFPKSRAWTFEHEGVPLFVDDQYCVTASCPCSEVILSYFRIERRGPHDSEGVLLGAVRYDLRTGHRKPESTVPGPSATTLLRLTETLFKARPATHDELDGRFRFMRGFADWLAQRRSEQRHPPAAAMPGRNEPCPCGSGRKYKKCCMP
ncbi:MAG: SEC-C metal-binding domain-containing protein [Bryobacteraceae bacterium]